MNWYKKIIKFCQNMIIDDPRGHGGRGYLDIGHKEMPNKEYKKPNIIWIYVNGEVLTEDEVEGDYGYITHSKAFPGLIPAASYLGRYERDTGDLSIIARGELQKLREIPESVLLNLKQKFRYINNLHRFK